MKQKVDFDDYVEDYNLLLNESTNFFSPSDEYFARYKVDVVKNSYLNSPVKVLEYGCGIGRNIPFLRDAFPDSEIHGSDISPASLELAGKLNPGINFFNENDLTNTGLKYDLIFIAGVFHHIPLSMRDDVIGSLKQRLSKEGSMFIFEHNPFNPVTRRIVDRCPYDEDAILLRPAELRKRLHAGGFDFVRQAYCLFVPPKLQSALFLEAYLGWLPLGGQYWTHARHVA
jgi:SAM-dependent methyltransferase